MGKRVSAVAVLLATSFLGSLLALVLVGRNPLVGPSSDLARTESLREGFDGSPVTVPGSPSPSTSSSASSEPQAVEDAVQSDSGPFETTFLRAPGSAAQPSAEGAASGTVELTEPAEEDGVVAKTTSEANDDVHKENGKASGHDKAKDGSAEEDAAADEVSKGSAGGPQGGSKVLKEPKEPKGSKSGTDGATAEKSKGSGKGTKVEKDTGSGKGSSEPHGKGKSKY